MFKLYFKSLLQEQSLWAYRKNFCSKFKPTFTLKTTTRSGKLLLFIGGLVNVILPERFVIWKENLDP